MKNRLLVGLILLSAIFPIVAMAYEVGRINFTAMIVFVVIVVVWVAVMVAAMYVRPRNTGDADTPQQAIPTIKGTAAKKEGSSKNAGAVTKKPVDNRRQRSR